MWLTPRPLCNTPVIPEHQELGGSPSAALSPRLLWIDISRTVALLGMIIFHFVRDLELFALIEAGTTTQGAWAVFARLVAGAFLFIAGVSFVLAHQSGFQPIPWAKRLFMVSGAAAIVTLVTFIAVPDRFIYFGILHSIAAASVIAVAMLALSGWVLVLFAVVIVCADNLWSPSVISSPVLAWIGVASTNRPSLDFIPLIPWLSAFLAGMAFAKIVPIARIDVPTPHRRLAVSLAWPGRHSLAIYLLHQPILLAVIWLAVAIT